MGNTVVGTTEGVNIGPGTVRGYGPAWGDWHTHPVGDAVMATVGEAAFGGLLIGERQPGVVAAEHRFAERRLDHLSTWKPREDDLAKLGEVVNHKAGREIM